MAMRAYPQLLATTLRQCVGGVGRLGRQLLTQCRIRSAGTERRRLESQKLDRFQDMGRIVYEMFLEEKVKTPRLLSLCQTVAKLDAAGRETEERVAALRHEA